MRGAAVQRGRALGRFEPGRRWLSRQPSAATPMPVAARITAAITPSQPERYHPPYASIVVDANSGEVLQATNADSPRHPASLTKIMTLYLLFERLEAGKIKLNTELQVSAHAAAQAPSKLGLKPGETIRSKTPSARIVTKSANDVAVVVGRSARRQRADFAQDDDRQGARARHDAHRLPQRLRPAERRSRSPPRATRRCSAARSRTASRTTTTISRPAASSSAASAMRNHNHLLGSVDGVDGIKTGYIHESGFNIVTSVHRGNRHIVAVVFGGRTASWRDARMRSLIDEQYRGRSVKRTAPLVVEALAKPKRKLPPRPTPAAAALVAYPGAGRRAAGRGPRAARLDRADQADRRSRPSRSRSRPAPTRRSLSPPPSKPHAGAADRSPAARSPPPSVKTPIRAPLAAGQGAGAADQPNWRRRCKSVPIPAEPAARPRAAAG